MPASIPRSDLSFLRDYEVVIFGSYASKTANNRSDIDTHGDNPEEWPKYVH